MLVIPRDFKEMSLFLGNIFAFTVCIVTDLHFVYEGYCISSENNQLNCIQPRQYEEKTMKKR